jgi:hypothetical protein
LFRIVKVCRIAAHVASYALIPMWIFLLSSPSLSLSLSPPPPLSLPLSLTAQQGGRIP